MNKIRKALFLVVVLACSITFSGLFQNKTYATRQQAEFWCKKAKKDPNVDQRLNGPWGALWLEKDGSETIVITEGDSTVKVDMTGSATSCARDDLERTDVHATQVRSNNNFLTIPTDRFYRGSFPDGAGPDTWTVNAEKVKVEIDLTKLNLKVGKNQVQASIHRCMYAKSFKYGTVVATEKNTCDNAPLPITILVQKKISYQTQARSYVKVKQGDKTVRETVGKQGNGPIVAKVGQNQKIEFNHQLTNLGDATDDTIDQVIIRGLRDYGPAHGIIGTDHLSLYNYAKKNNIKRANKGKGEIFAEAGDGKNNQMNSNYLGLTIEPKHVGKTFCTDITWTAKGGRKNMGPINDGYQFENSDHNSATYPACVYVPYENDIQPCMSNGGSSPCGGETEGEPGTKITGVPKIKNGGNTKTPSNTQWVITKWEVPNRKENIPAPTQIDNEEKDPCKHYKSKFDNAAANCGVVAKSGSGDNSIGANATLTNFGNISAIQNFSVPENAQIGTRFCFAISVSPRVLKDSDSPSTQTEKAGKEWRHSAPLCFKVVKKPKLQVWGGGIFSNKGIKASSSVYETKGTFSSWSEFEAMTGRNGRIISFNSASSNTQTKLNFGSASAGWENLIGRNKDGHIAAITALYGSAAKNDPARRIAVENYTSPSVSLGGGANNTAQKYNDGWTRVIYAKNLLIDGDITSRNNIANGVQQTIIVADNIRISNKVNRIDAWLITRGNGVVNTCAQNANNDTISYVNEANCSRQLTINGPILTNRFLPWRTAYSDIKNPDKPSEIINQRADSYLWANKQTSAASRTIRTTYSKELPIRY